MSRQWEQEKRLFLRLIRTCKGDAMQINKERMIQQMEKLATYGAHGEEGITRFTYTPEFNEAMEYVKGCMTDAGLKTKYDPVGNLIGIYPGTEGGKIFVGSHIDTVKCGGMFDGAIGVIGAIEAVRTLNENGIRTKQDIYVCVYLDEEFGALGSKAIAGKELDAVSMQKVCSNGHSMQDVADSEIEMEESDYALELHIEQGSILENTNRQIGIVDSILASYKYRGTVEGHAGHAGTLQMKSRDDAFVKMAEITLEFQRLVCGYENMVGTIGKVEVLPGARNIVPGKVEFLLEMRSPKQQDMKDVEKKLRHKFTEKGFCLERTEEYEPVIMEPAIKSVMEEICEKDHIAYMHLHSGAGHDIQSFYGKTKCGLLFIPSVNGVSHCPKERTKWEDCEEGINVLMKTMIALDL